MTGRDALSIGLPAEALYSGKTFLQMVPMPRSLILPDGGRLVLDQGPLVMGIVNVTPDSFSDGGRLADAGPILLDTFRSVLAQRTLPSTAGPVEVVVSELGTAAEVRGALALALDHAGIAQSMAVAG